MVTFSVPSEYYLEKQGFGDERLMSAKEWLYLVEKVNYRVKAMARYYRIELVGLKTMMRNLFKGPLHIRGLFRRPSSVLLKPLEILVKINKLE